MLAALWIVGAGLRTIAWTQPRGDPFSVALVQGNIAQNLKFNEDALEDTLETYRRLVLGSNARLDLVAGNSFASCCAMKFHRTCLGNCAIMLCKTAGIF